MPAALLRRIPMGCYFGAAIVALGVISNDIRGIVVGLVVAVVATIATHRPQSRATYPAPIEVPIRTVRARKPLRERLREWFGTPGAVARTYLWVSFVGIALGIVAGAVMVVLFVVTDRI